MPDDAQWHERRFTEALKRQPVNDNVSFLTTKGRAFSPLVRFKNIGNGDSIFVHVDNPSDSGYDFNIIVMARATGLADIDMSFNPTKNGANDTASYNLKSGSSRSFSGQVATFDETNDTGTSPSHGTIVLEDFVPGTAQGIPNVLGQAVDGAAVTIDQGDSKLFQLNNNSGGQLNRMSLNMVIVELNGTYVEIE